MNRPSLILLCGIPGSGKSTYAHNYIQSSPTHTMHLSSDSIRKELYGNESIQGNPSEVFTLMQERAVEALNNGNDVLYDATNITRKDRASIITACPKFTKIECHIIWTPIEMCIERDANRERTVGKGVIDRMLKRFPYYDEGIDEILIIKPEGFNVAEYTQKCFNDMHISHDNPHHTKDIYHHCESAHRYLFDNNVFGDLAIAALMHDIGKPYTKAFRDTKGNPCESAHYYQHQCTGSWLSYGTTWGNPYVGWLISTHMEPYFNSKYYRSLAPYLKRDIDILHKADVESH